MVDLARQSLGKRKGEGDEPSPRPAKQQTFWVQVPPRRKVLSVKREASSPEVATEAEGATLALKQDSDQELANALAVTRNVSYILNPNS